MRFFVHWFMSAAAILIAAYIMPGVWVVYAIPALQACLIFGALTGSLRLFFRAVDVPVNPYTLGLFALIVNGALVFSTNVLMPGLFVRGFSVAVAFIFFLTAADVLIAAYAVPDWKQAIRGTIGDIRLATDQALLWSRKAVAVAQPIAASVFVAIISVVIRQSTIAK
jgi:putative membrane protein